MTSPTRRTLILAALAAAAIRPAAARPVNWLYGLTIDDSWQGKTRVADIIAALRILPRRPTVRLVMSHDTAPRAYQPLITALRPVADIMATPVDSYDMKHYRSTRDYLARFQEAYAAYGGAISLWEIGNEINGEDWLGNDPAFIADKARAAWQYIRAHGGKTALTAYHFAPGAQSLAMHDWLARYIPPAMRQGLDYLLVSYYEDDNDGYQPDWTAVFRALRPLFPHSALGIGECGKTAAGADEAEKTALMRHYYHLHPPVEGYIGGGFWWYWVQDGVPADDNAFAQALAQTWAEAHH